ncbi:hypothetical protein M2284_000945 [Rhodococcus sp. LBL1]|uniref:Uncharacterized protein n=1 Tax=Prescottella agglutinans TaxID=1644129 RepID=A0ABT6MHI6_9NOCA|nr:hypothetical protein [Prescottella agglutinans]MDH6676747.1 hypothetical protein [Rhodococcus sp. LBL1]MDH6682960.1 hypothetical protein [Rhodococcus sp. LBL2]
MGWSTWHDLAVVDGHIAETAIVMSPDKLGSWVNG